MHGCTGKRRPRTNWKLGVLQKCTATQAAVLFFTCPSQTSPEQEVIKPKLGALGNAASQGLQVESA